MRTSFLLFVIFSCLLLLAACQSNPAVTSTQHSAGDSFSIDSSRSTGLQPGNASLMALDSTQEAPKENYDTLDPAIRSHFSDIQAFLDFIKRPNSDYNVGFDKWIKNFRIENIDSLLNFITADSLEIDDADSDPGKDSLKYSRTLLHQQLTRRKGAAFNMIGAISLHISIPYPQYSHTTFSTDKRDSVPNLNVNFSEFELYFRAEKSSADYKLCRLESYHISDR